MLKKGHYCECQSIQRDIFELFYLSEYLIKNPDKVDPWLHGVQIKHSHIAKELDLPEPIRDMYGLMCDYTHPNIHGAQSNFLLGPSCEQIFFKDVPEFHKPTAHGLLLQQICFIYCSTCQFFQHFEKYNVFDANDKKNLNELYIKWQNEFQYWEKLCDDSDYEMFP